MADEYNDQDLYGDYIYEDSETPANISALIAMFRNLIVNSAMIENLAVQDAHIQSVAANKIEAGEIQVDSNNLAFNALWKKDTLGWDLGAGVSRNTSIQPWGYPTIVSAQSGNTVPVWRGAKTNSAYRIPCAPGEWFTGSVYWRVFDPATFNSESGLLVELEWYNSSGQRLSTSSSGLISDVSGRSAFERISATAQAPSDAVSVGINFWVRYNGTAYFGRPQLQRGKFLTDFTDNGTYIGPNGIMTTDLRFSGILEGPNVLIQSTDGSSGLKFEHNKSSVAGKPVINASSLGTAGSNYLFVNNVNPNGASAPLDRILLEAINVLVGPASGTSQAKLEVVSMGTPGLEVRSKNGGFPYLDLSNDETTNFHARIRLGTGNSIVFYYINPTTGAIEAKHTFRADGTKSGGSIEIDGENLGMSPIDSPQVPIEYVEFDISLTPEGTKVPLDIKFVKAVEKFAVFPNKGEVVEKGEDYFIIKGEGTADCRIYGLRKDYADVFWTSMKLEEELPDIDKSNP